MYKVIDKIWRDVIKGKYKFGKDYISMETNEYWVVAPFNENIMIELNDKLWLENKGVGLNFRHCVCHDTLAFAMWYKILYREGRLKVFFIKKNIDIYSELNGLLDEFTCWIDRNDKLPHFTHDIKNELVNGTYKKGLNESVYDPNCVEGRERDLEFVNALTSKVIDRLFTLYDEYKDVLESTLSQGNYILVDSKYQ